MGSWTRSVRAAGAIAVFPSLSLVRRAEIFRLSHPRLGPPKKSAQRARALRSREHGWTRPARPRRDGGVHEPGRARRPRPRRRRRPAVRQRRRLRHAGGAGGEPGVPQRGDGTFEDATQASSASTGLPGSSRSPTSTPTAIPTSCSERPTTPRASSSSADGRGLGRCHRHHLPAAELSVGDLELGDVDADGDLDIVLADWGTAPRAGPAAGCLLWLNDGAARFTDATAEQMPQTLVRFSWDLELVDVDNDWDLDIAISCKLCTAACCT